MADEYTPLQQAQSALAEAQAALEAHRSENAELYAQSAQLQEQRVQMLSDLKDRGQDIGERMVEATAEEERLLGQVRQAQADVDSLTAQGEE